MLRRSALVLAVIACFGAIPAAVDADGQIAFRIVGRADPSNRSVNLTLVNHTPDTLAYTTWDGGGVHNGLERLDAGNWVPVGFGYCGLGMDGEVTVAPGARRRVRANIDGVAGTYRVTLDVERRSAGGTVDQVVVSDPFQVP